MKLYADITKTEEQDDGTIKVWGYASSEAVDSDGEVITSDAMKAALPDYMKFGAVREMHQSMAAGTAIEASVQDDGRTFFGAHVVDPVAVKKVQTGVYKGFSIGGKVLQKEANRITGLRLVEVSLVDRPANPEAVFTMMKAEEMTDENADVKADDATKAESVAERTDGEKPKVVAAKADDAATRKAEALAGLEKAAGAEVWDADWAIDILCGIVNLASCEAMESEPEGAQIAMLNAAADKLKEFIMSELSENKDAEVVQMANQIADLAKAGKKFSAATKDALAKCHGAMKEACDHLDKLGYDKEDEEEADKAAANDDLAKAHKADLQEIAKGCGLSVADDADDGAVLKAAVAELLKVRKEHADLLASPAVPKGAAKAAPVSKSADLGGDDVKVAEVKKSDGSTDEAASLIKAAWSKPIRI